MRILFVHQNCPGQYKHLAPFLAARPGNEVVFITQPDKPALPKVRQAVYTLKRNPSPETHFYLRNFEEGVLHGQAVVRIAYQLRRSGFVPDVICAHPGWGEALYLKDVFPTTPLLGYCEFYYRARGSDVGFDPSRKVTIDDICRVRTKNGVQLLSLEAADAGISPTRWQRSQFPSILLDRIHVIHDGVDTALAAPSPGATATLRNGHKIAAGDEVVTYVARNLEPYRGFPTFMRAIALSARRRPNCHYIIVGGDGVSYGAPAPGGKTYRQIMLDEVTIDPARVHFLGRVPYNGFLRLLQISAAHVYLTYPFVLSWSMLEAMSAGCLIIGSNTTPVTEMIEDGKNGLLVDFFSPEQIADRIDEVLDHKDRMAALRRRARQTVVERYELKSCLQQQVRLIESLARGQRAGQPKARRATGD